MQEILRLVFSYLSGVWRHRWIALIIAAMACPIGWFYVATLPDVDRAQARVFVESSPGSALQGQDSAEQILQRDIKDHERRMIGSGVDSVRFGTLDPAETPRKASGPNRVGMSSVVFGGALAAGIAVAFFISMMRPVFVDRRQLTETMGIPVLGSVDMIWTRQQRRKSRVANFAFGTGLASLFGAYALVLTIFSLGIDVMSYLPV